MANYVDLNQIYEEEQGENEVIGDNGVVPNILETAADLLTGDDEPTPPTEEPVVGMEFDTGEEFAAFCYTYAYKAGFEIQIRTNHIIKHFTDQGVTRGGSGDQEPRFHMMDRIRFHCSMGNKTKKDAPPVLCKFFVDARVNDQSGKIRIGTLNLVHSHDKLPEGSRHSTNYRHIGEYFKTRMMLNEQAGIPITRNYNALALEAGGFENLPFTQRDMRNAINRERRLSRFYGDTQQMIDHFNRLKALDDRFFFKYELDENGKILSIFWADALCRAMYQAFGDPTSFDSTFSTNRYKLPFCPFVGVNHHGNTIVFAAALVSYEDTESFEFVFRCWIECMGRAPSIIVTDECKGIEGAINSTFPDAKHRLCLWHVLQNFDKNLNKHPEFAGVDRDFRTLIDECYTEEELGQMWQQFLVKYNLQGNIWLLDKWAKRRRWVPLYWLDSFGASMQSTQRSEQTNRYLKITMSIETPLMVFIEQYEAGLARKVEDESRNNYKDKRHPEKIDETNIVEYVFGRVYTNQKVKDVKEEVQGCVYTNAEILEDVLGGSIKRFKVTSKETRSFWKRHTRTWDVTMDTVTQEYKCACKMFEFKGILCRHIIKCIYVMGLTEIPGKYILDRWRKDIVRGYENIKVGDFDPARTERVNKSLTVTIKNDYVKRLALHDDMSYAIYNTHNKRLIKELEAHQGIANRDSFDDGCFVNRTFGRKRLEPKAIVRRNERPVVEVGDAPDKRGTGRRSTRGQGKRRRKPTDNAEGPPTQQQQHTVPPQPFIPRLSQLSTPQYTGSLYTPQFSQSQYSGSQHPSTPQFSQYSSSSRYF